MSNPAGASSRLSVSVITPSFNMLPYLKRCCASVADQQGPSCEHIVVDGQSTDGSVEWLASQRQITSIVGKDDGMYDAINKGLARCSGDIVAYLSCDEQYLPGTLAHVERFFATHPQVDGVFGDTLVTWPDGRLISFQKSYLPIWPFIITSHLYVFPSSMFLRRAFIERGEFFESSFKDVGDAEFVVRLLRKGYRLTNTRRYLSAFTITGANRGQSPKVIREAKRLEQMMPPWPFRYRLPLNAARLVLKFASGSYFERKPLKYSLYVSDPENGRASFQVQHPSPRWRTT